jgi:hypothetical protein
MKGTDSLSKQDKYLRFVDISSIKANAQFGGLTQKGA